MKFNWPERRRRHAVRLDAVVTRLDGTELTAIVTDLSLDGCCLTGSFRIGERVRVKVPRIGTMTGEVRWAFLGRAGLRFLTAREREQESAGDGATS